MNIGEIYTEISTHMLNGVMIHESMANYYDFLGLKGYSKCHEYHYLSELNEQRKINSYYINHYNKLIENKAIAQPDIIPNNWYNHVRQDVDFNTKINAIKNGFTKWVKWENDTKKFYEKMYIELMNINEITSAIRIKELIYDVDEELKDAENEFLNIETIDYDLSQIISEQELLYNKFNKKISKIKMF